MNSTGPSARRAGRVAARQRRTSTVPAAARIPVATTDARTSARSDSVGESAIASALSGIAGEQSGHGTGVTRMTSSCRTTDDTYATPTRRRSPRVARRPVGNASSMCSETARKTFENSRPIE